MDRIFSVNVECCFIVYLWLVNRAEGRLILIWSFVCLYLAQDFGLHYYSAAALRIILYIVLHSLDLS